MDIVGILAIAAASIIGLLIGRASKAGATSGQAQAATSPAQDDAPRSSSLAMFDVDDLSGVNRTNDFDTGDRLLNAVADVLLRALPEEATLERLDSGRFLVWSMEEDAEGLVAMADRLRQLAGCVQVEGPAGRVARTLTVGIVVTTANENRARAILRADTALAAAKQAGGNQTRFVDPVSRPSLIPGREVIEEAIRTRALEYHVQPIVRLSDRQPIGVENLLRWNQPDGSVTGPARFLDTLHRLPEAGADLLPEAAVEAAQVFLKADDSLYATFNITGAVLDGKGSAACRWLNSILDALPNDRLVLELVETAIIIAPDRARDLLKKLRARGVRIALDDFGTGLSNLERLRRYQVDIIKVDRAFIRELGTTGREEAILTAMVSLARSMKLDLVTEGLETEEQVRIVAGLGVEYGQGYYLGRPAPASDWADRMGLRP